MSIFRVTMVNVNFDVQTYRFCADTADEARGMALSVYDDSKQNQLDMFDEQNGRIIVEEI